MQNINISDIRLMLIYNVEVEKYFFIIEFYIESEHKLLISDDLINYNNKNRW